MTQYQYSKFKEYCDLYGWEKSKLIDFHCLKRDIFISRIKKKMFKEVEKPIRKMLYFLVRVMRRFEKWVQEFLL